MTNQPPQIDPVIHHGYFAAQMAADAAREVATQYVNAAAHCGDPGSLNAIVQAAIGDSWLRYAEELEQVQHD